MALEAFSGGENHSRLRVESHSLLLCHQKPVQKFALLILLLASIYPYFQLVYQMERKTGARGLRSILESVLLDIMYDLPSEKDVSKVIVDESVIKGTSEPMRIYENQDHPKAAPE